jgi:hypothetical protein
MHSNVTAMHNVMYAWSTLPAITSLLAVRDGSKGQPAESNMQTETNRGARGRGRDVTQPATYPESLGLVVALAPVLARRCAAPPPQAGCPIQAPPPRRQGSYTDNNPQSVGRKQGSYIGMWLVKYNP